MNKKEKTSFWGRPIKDEKGNVVGYQDEFGDVRTSKEITNEVSGCLIFLIAALGLAAGCTMRVRSEIQKRREKNLNKPMVESVSYRFRSANGK